VLIERDSTMGCRGHRIPKNVDTTRKRWFYLPRVKYNRKTDENQIKREKYFFLKLEYFLEKEENTREDYKQV